MKYLLILLLAGCSTIDINKDLECKASCTDCGKFELECKASDSKSANVIKVKI